jgi:RNA polymerase sigma-70 factor (ECF subfamily)
MPRPAVSVNAGSSEGLVSGFRRGDPVATEALAGRACRLALRTAGAILRSRDEAADIAQDVAVDVLGSLPRLRNPGAFDAWVHRITVRHALRYVEHRGRARAAETPLALLGESEAPAVPDDGDPEARLVARGVLAEALAELPPRQALALALRYVHDLPDAAIAAALECREGTVHALLSRGRAALRDDPRLAQLAPAPTTGGPR